MLALSRTHGLAMPEINAWITLDDGIAYEADLLWRREKLIVETDGYRVHSSRRAFEHDRLRDQQLKLARYEVIHFTWRQVSRDPDRVLRTMRKLLARLARP
jgi:very-short-patch-repair endonuclease